MKIKKIILLATYFMIITAPLCAQIATPWLFRGDKFPPPKDPRECETMQLSQADLEYKDKAEDYMKQGKSDLAVEELKKISSDWASHWFLSYLYESDFRLKDALREVNWLKGGSDCRELEMYLEDRADNIEEAIREGESWDKRWEDSPQNQKKKIIFE